MKTVYRYFARPKRRSALRGIFRLNFVVGGAASTLLEELLKDKDAVNAVFDNARAIQLLREQYGDNGVFYFVMGDCETTKSVHCNSDASTRDASSSVSNTNVSLGYGARLHNSCVAADKLIASEEFQSFLAGLPDEALRRTGGRPLMFDLQGYGSIAGAAYAGTGPKFADVFARSLSYFDRAIQVQFNIIGPITFAGLAPRARPNAASSLLNHLGYCLFLSKPHELRVAKRLMLREFMPFGDDQDLRNHFLRLDHCMMASVQMQDRLMQPAPNEEQDDLLGAIMSREVDYKTPLDRRLDIAAITALGFLNAIEEAKGLLLPDISTVTEIVFDQTEVAEGRRQEPEVIAGLLFNQSPEKLLDSIDRPGRNVFYQMRYSSSLTDSIPEHISATMAGYPTSLGEFMSRLELLMGYQQIAIRELSVIDDEIEELEDRRNTFKERFIKVVKKARARRSRKLPRGTVEFIAQLRSIADEIHDLQSQRNAGERALVTLDAEVNFLESKLSSIVRELKKWTPKGVTSVTNQSVTFAAIDDFFDRVMRLELLSDSQKLDLFCEAPSQVTLFGLAKIAGAKSERLEAIADRIVNGPYETMGPSHGAQNMQFSNSTVYALPPCEPDAESTLVEEIKKLDKSASVVFGDTLAGGACVQRVRFRRFHSLQSLFAGLPGHDLWVAYTDALNALNTTDGWETLNALGGRVEGERFVFDGPIREPRIAVINQHDHAESK